jgi:hypothetical protein
MNDRSLFYFPACSAGPIAAAMKKNQWTPNKKLSFRYYSNEFPEEYRIPAFLTTAGHCYKTENYIQAFDFPKDSVIFGDSGGFQIAMGKLKYTDELRERIFHWLEDNSTIAANLDIPPKVTKSGHFDECLDISYQNFKYFEKNQTGKIKFLNVLQGLTEQKYAAWYNKVKGMEFNGWAIGVAQRTAPLYQILASTVVLMEGKEHEKKTNEWIHFLGVTATVELVYLTQLQKSMNDIGSHIQISTDSSTPNIQAKFGGMFVPRGWNWQVIHVPRDITLKSGKIDYSKGGIFPPVNNEIGYILREEYKDTDIIGQFKSEAYAALVLYNLSVFKDTQKLLHDLVRCDDYFQEQILPKEIFQNLKLIDRVIKADNPRKEFQRLLPNLSQQSPVGSTTASQHNFFI